jgi:hypothetical protein
MDETTLNERIGSFAEDGSIAQWPKRAANGTSYDRSNATLQGIGGVHFVVLPNNWQDEDVIASLRALVAPKAAPVIEAQDWPVYEDVDQPPTPPTPKKGK